MIRATALILLILASSASAADRLDELEKQLDQVVELFETGPEQPAVAALEKAIEGVDAAVKATPDDAKAHFLRGRAYLYRGGKGDDAIAGASYAKAAKLAPDNAEYKFHHGLQLAESGKSKEALAQFVRACELDPKHVQATSMVGVMHAQAGDEAAALKWFSKAAELDPKHANAQGNVGQIYQKQGKLKESLAAYEKAIAAAPDDWHYRSKLVQLYQGLGRRDDRDRARAALLKMWADGKVDQPLFCREQFEAKGKQVQAYEYFELEGDRALRYSFIVMKPDGKEPDYRITLGSYEMITQIAREGGRIGKDERMFHLDGYYAEGEHRTFGMYTKEPDYEATRALVVQVLEGKLKAVSGTKKGKDGDAEIEINVPAE